MKIKVDGQVWDVVTETVELPGGERVVRDLVLHPSAVAVLALDDHERVLAVHQYRHAVRATLWELPAGLLDVEGESPLATARRELWEETHHEADEWSVLVDFLPRPFATHPSPPTMRIWGDSCSSGLLPSSEALGTSSGS